MEIEAGCDEVGRGSLAGPVVAAAVILPQDYYHPLLDDSKKVKPTHRLTVEEDIKKKAIAWAIGQATNQEIDQINIAQASYLAMHRAIAHLQVRPTLLLIDGKYFKNFEDIPHQTIIRGDSQFNAIAAASILAKVYRDTYMKKLALQFLGYSWETNLGYPTQAHKKALQELKSTVHHRKTFLNFLKSKPSAPFQDNPGNKLV